jgi:hypothetical protein
LERSRHAGKKPPAYTRTLQRASRASRVKASSDTSYKSDLSDLLNVPSKPNPARRCDPNPTFGSVSFDYVKEMQRIKNTEKDAFVKIFSTIFVFLGYFGRLRLVKASGNGNNVHNAAPHSNTASSLWKTDGLQLQSGVKNGIGFGLKR